MKQIKQNRKFSPKQLFSEILHVYVGGKHRGDIPTYRYYSQQYVPPTPNKALRKCKNVNEGKLAIRKQQKNTPMYDKLAFS